MAIYLTIGALSLDVQTEGAERSEDIYIGSTARSFAGSLMIAQRSQKGVWQFQTAPLAPATVAAFRATLAGAPVQACSGDLMDVGHDCRVTIVGERFIEPNVPGVNHMSVLTLRLEEV